jgi:Ca2+-binding RTX toxin-like protein
VDLLAGSALDSFGNTDSFRDIEGVRGGGLADTLRGSEIDNRLVGNDGNDLLDGRGGADTLDGGAGADTMQGGNGDDTYVVDTAGDRVIEVSGAGTDHVLSSVSFNLTGQNAENLTLTGMAAISGIGNGLANLIVGSGSANLLQGLGGADTLDGGLGADTLEGGTGNDRLTGGAGADSFVIGQTSVGLSSLAQAKDLDTILDLSFAAGDRIEVVIAVGGG